MGSEPCRLTVQWSEQLATGPIYWITAKTRDGAPVFECFRAARTLIRVLGKEADRGGHRSLAYVVLPSRLHWLVRPGRLSLPLLTARIKTRTALQLGQSIWQAGLHGQVLDPGDHPMALARYLLGKPVRVGLTSRLGLYPHWDAAWLQPAEADEPSHSAGLGPLATSDCKSS